jgi:hypothetical protein
LRIEVIEEPRNVKHHGNDKEILPKSIDEIKRLKLKSEGMKESEFIIGTRFMLNWIDKNELFPFLKKSD